MSVFSIESVFTQKMFKSLVNMNYQIIINDLSQITRDYKNNIELKEEIKNIQPNIVPLSLTFQNVRQENVVPLSLIHPKNCQPKIPIKDRCSLLRPNFKTMDDIFDIQSAINSILSHSEDMEYKNINPYYKWECENFSEEYGYTHFYIVVSKVGDLSSYYAIELQRVSGTKSIIYLILHQLFERLNILS